MKAPSTPKMRLTPRQAERAESDWAEAIERAEREPGTALVPLAFVAAEATNRSAIDVLRCWGLAS